MATSWYFNCISF